MKAQTDNQKPTSGDRVEGASIIFVNPARQVLLFLRDNKPGIPFPGCWDLLGGRVEPSETPTECIVRELQEEIEYSLENPKLFQRRVFDDRVENTYWELTELDIASTPLHEGQRLHWFSESEIDDLDIAFQFKDVLREFYRQRLWG